MPDQFSVGGTYGHRGLAEGIECRSRLLHLVGVLHVRGNAGQHFGGSDGFGDVVGATGGKGGNDVLCFAQPGHENDGNVLGGKIRFQASRDLKSVHARHHRIKQYDVRQALAGPLQRGLAIRGDEYGVARFIERIVEERKILRNVIDDQDNVRDGAVQWEFRRHRVP